MKGLFHRTESDLFLLLLHKSMASSGKLVSTIEAYLIPKKGRNQVSEGKVLSDFVSDFDLKLIQRGLHSIFALVVGMLTPLYTRSRPICVDTSAILGRADI